VTAKISSRNDIALLLEEKKFQVGVELGVQKGVFALNNLQKWTSCKKYYLIDIWTHVSYKVYKAKSNVDNREQAHVLSTCQQNLKPFHSKVVYLRNTTVNAALFVEDMSVDFIYVDARHDYCGCKEDIELWWPKLKHGGIMAGHDYLSRERVQKVAKSNHTDWRYCDDGSFHEDAVRGAVNEFADKHNLTIHTTKKCSSWIYSPKK